jgi:hypothetical protein
MKHKKQEERSQLVQVLQFLDLTWKAGEDQAMYCMMGEHSARSFNSVIAAGTSIEEDLQACPQTALMLAAILRCPDGYVITQLSPEKLHVRSVEPDGRSDFEAYIPCIAPASLSWPIPDAPVAAIDDRLIEALQKVAPLLSATGETLVEQSIQLNAGSCMATNRSVILEAWHGFDLPSGLLLPKAIIVAIRKTKKKLSAFGYSPVTATFYFEDSTWLRTQLFQGKWPEIKKHLDAQTCTRPVPPELFKAAKKVSPFSGNGSVYVKGDLISSHPFNVKEEGSSLKLPIGSEHRERSYDAKNLSLIAKHVTQWDETMRDDGTYFTGENIRGLIHHQGPSNVIEDDDIPF